MNKNSVFFRIITLLWIIINCSNVLFAQCTLTVNDDTQAEVLACISSCGCSVVNLPDGVTIIMNGNLDLTSAGDLTFTIQGFGSLEFDGNGSNADQLLLTANSSLIIENTSNTSALVESGSSGSIRIYIGTELYNGNQFPEIISAGGIGPGGILPLVWGSVSASFLQKDLALIRWTTHQEMNNRLFIIEHATDKGPFEEIAQFNSYGNSDFQQSYEYRYLYPFSGLEIFRIKQIDFNGVSSYSPSVMISLFEEKNIKFYVDFLKDELHIDKGTKEIRYSYKIIDLAGKTIKNGYLTHAVSVLDIAAMSQGYYFIVFSTLGKISTWPFLKK